jgi:hypothetical protein
MKRALALLLILLFSGCRSKSDKPQDGDIIFHTSQSPQSVAVQRATRSRYSHMGVVFISEGKLYVFEATQPVKFTPFEDWVKKGLDGHYVMKRLKDESPLSPEGLQKLRQAAIEFEGKSYDATFEWSNDRIYCSELVWKMYDRALGIQIGRPQKLRDFDLDSPVVKQKLHERYGDRVPLDETVISPQAMFESELIETVRSQ